MSDAADCLQVTTTLPSREAADQLARRMVEAGLAACAQVHGPVTSIYRWEGRVETATEWYCHLKTTAERLPALESELRRQHPYELPEVTALPLGPGGLEYRHWIAQAVLTAG